MSVDPKSATPTAGQASKEYWTIQGLRFVAAFAVVCVHSTFYTHERLSADVTVYAQGAHGVRLFFVISGFVMILSSQRLVAQTKGWQAFAIKRILRILPLYWLVIAFKLAIMLFAAGLALHTRMDPAYIAKSFFFIPAYNLDGEIKPFHGVGWTLNFEMFFYLLFTVAMLLRVRPERFVGPILIVLAAASPLRTAGWPVPFQFLCDPVVLDFLAGMMIARWCQRGLAIHPAIAWALVAVGLAGLFVPYAMPPMPQLASSLIITVFSAATILGAAALEPRIGRAMPRWAVFMGGASYSLYLIHPIIAPATPAIFARLELDWPWLAVLGSIALASVAGAVVYVLVETPLTRFLNGKVRGFLAEIQSPLGRLPAEEYPLEGRPETTGSSAGVANVSLTAEDAV
jgi:peptidoglycan/LPS O-acetylase OafA/YrhL